jgi:hypothetical protein
MHCFQPEIAPAPMGILAHLGKALSYRSVADPQFRRNLPHTGPGRTQAQNFIAINNPDWAAKLLTSSPRVADTGSDPFTDEVALQLSHGGDNCE